MELESCLSLDPNTLTDLCFSPSPLQLSAAGVAASTGG